MRTTAMFCRSDEALPKTSSGAFGQILRKEVIQPQVPLRLPCYDLVPITEFALGALFPCGLRQRCWAPPTFVA